MFRCEIVLEADDFEHAKKLKQKVYETYGIKVRQFIIKEDEDE